MADPIIIGWVGSCGLSIAYLMWAALRWNCFSREAEQPESAWYSAALWLCCTRVGVVLMVVIALRSNLDSQSRWWDRP